MRAAKPSRMHPASMSRSGTAVASAEALDNGEDPQRASLVETRHRRLAREFEHAVEDPSQGAAIRRTWYDRSKFGSTSQRGVDRQKGTSTSRCQTGKGAAGTFKAVQQFLAGGRSRMRTAVIVCRSRDRSRFPTAPIPCRRHVTVCATRNGECRPLSWFFGCRSD